MPRYFFQWSWNNARSLKTTPNLELVNFWPQITAIVAPIESKPKGIQQMRHFKLLDLCEKSFHLLNFWLLFCIWEKGYQHWGPPVPHTMWLQRLCVSPPFSMLPQTHCHHIFFVPFPIQKWNQFGCSSMPFLLSVWVLWDIPNEG